MLDTKSLVRRQELLSRARRARHEWLEGCRGKRLLEKDEKKGSLRRECEVEVIEESAVGIFGSAGQVIRFLSDVMDEPQSYPIVPLAGDDDWCRAVDAKVDVKCQQLVAATEDSEDKAEKKEEADIDALIEKLKHPDFADVVRSTQHFVDALRRDDEEEEEDDEEKNAAKEKGLLARGKIAADLLFSKKKEEPVQEDEEEEEEPPPVITGLNFTTATADPALVARIDRVKSFAKRVVAMMNTEDTQLAAETILFRRLAPRFFGPLSDDAVIAKRAMYEDEFISRRLTALDFLDFKHLGAAAPTDRKIFEDGARFLEGLHTARAPGDATRRLKLAARRFEKSTNDASADLLPYFVVGLILTKPPRLASVANFLNLFVETATGGDAFVLTNLLGAVDFLANLQPSSLDDVQDKLALQEQLDNAKIKTQKDEEDSGTKTDESSSFFQTPRRPGRREVSAREVRALRLARNAESAVRASALAGTFAPAAATTKKTSDLLTDYQSLLAQVDALAPK